MVHSQMPYRESGQLFEVLCYDAAMACRRVTLKAHKGDRAFERRGKVAKQWLLELEVGLEGGEVLRVVAIGAELVADVFGGAEFAFVLIGDADLSKRLGERSLGKALSARQWEFANVEQRCDAGSPKRRKECRQGGPFVSDSEQIFHGRPLL